MHFFSCSLTFTCGVVIGFVNEQTFTVLICIVIFEAKAQFVVACVICKQFSMSFHCRLGAIGFICPLALSCYTANKYGENVCLACVPGGMAAMRTHMRLTYGIQVIQESKYLNDFAETNTTSSK